ncbi:UPF0729 protein C18orf32 homolog isoform X2 [Sceloporus undulatus]|nr:UPF0729 protein C18orf32 homolog isoform X2 [Sceloporus undulatus]
MVCIPCIVIPVLLWVYKRFLEPYLYPIISPFIKRFWSKKAVQEVPKEDLKRTTFESSMDESGMCEIESNNIANGFAGSGPAEVPDKKTD